MGVLLSGGSCDDVVQKASWCQEDVPTQWLEGTCHKGLFVLCPSKLAGKATWCPWLVPICAGVMQESHPPSLPGDFGDACPFTPVPGAVSPAVGLAEGWEQWGPEVFYLQDLPGWVLQWWRGAVSAEGRALLCTRVAGETQGTGGGPWPECVCAGSCDKTGTVIGSTRSSGSGPGLCAWQLLV